MKIKGVKNKIFISIFTFMFIFVGFIKPTPVSAGIWGEDMAATVMQITWEEVMGTIKETITATLKVTAKKIVSDRVNALLYGQGSPVISDYEEFITEGARTEAMIYTHNVFSSITNDTTNSVKNVGDSVELAVFNSVFGEEESKPNINNVIKGDVGEDVFDESKGGGPDAFLLALDNDQNNSFGMYVEGVHAAEEKKKSVELAKSTEGNSGDGFETTSAPGSVWAAMAASSATIGSQILVQADTIPEVVAAMASSLISKSIEAGVDKITRPIDERLIEVHNDIDSKRKEVELSIYKRIGN